MNVSEFKENFSNLNPREIYAWPISMQLFVGFVASLFVLGLGVALHLFPMNDKLEASVKKEENLKKEWIDKKRQAINLDLHKEQLEQITQDSDNLLKQLPNKSQIERLLLDINQVGVSRGLVFDLFKPENEKVLEFYAELPIKIKVRGSYEALGNFASDLGNLSRVVVITDMVLNPLNDSQEVLKMEALIKTFRYLEADELAKQKAERESANKNNRNNTKPAKAAK